MMIIVSTLAGQSVTAADVLQGIMSPDQTQACQKPCQYRASPVRSNKKQGRGAEEDEFETLAPCVSLPHLKPAFSSLNL